MNYRGLINFDSNKRQLYFVYRNLFGCFPHQNLLPASEGLHVEGCVGQNEERVPPVCQLPQPGDVLLALNAHVQQQSRAERDRVHRHTLKGAVGQAGHGNPERRKNIVLYS